MDELNFSDLKSGMECWAWRYDWPSGFSRPMSSMKPVRGVLAEWPDRIGDTTRGPGWFVPYRKQSRRPAFTKSIRVESVNLHDSQTNAEDAYNAAVRRAAARFLDIARIAQDDIVRTKRDGFCGDALEDYPVMRPDLSLDYSGVAAAARPELTMTPDPDSRLLPWEEFAEITSHGGLTAYDGVGTFQLDGKNCENAIVDMYHGLIYIPDLYAVPFHLVPTVFAGHNPEILWFDK